MHSYNHNIKTFNNATMHLTRVERSLYRDLIELYYDTEQPLPAVDFDRLARRVSAHSAEEKEALKFVLSEFFVRTGDVYSHNYCDEQIEAYRANIGAKAAAGLASAAARKKKAEARQKRRELAAEQNSTAVQQPLNGCATNHKPITNKKNINTRKKTRSKKDGSDSDADNIPSGGTESGSCGANDLLRTSLEEHEKSDSGDDAGDTQKMH